MFYLTNKPAVTCNCTSWTGCTGHFHIPHPVVCVSMGGWVPTCEYGVGSVWVGSGLLLELKAILWIWKGTKTNSTLLAFSLPLFSAPFLTPSHSPTSKIQPLDLQLVSVVLTFHLIVITYACLWIPHLHFVNLFLYVFVCVHVLVTTYQVTTNQNGELFIRKEIGIQKNPHCSMIVPCCHIGSCSWIWLLVIVFPFSSSSEQSHPNTVHFCFSLFSRSYNDPHHVWFALI